MANYTVIFSKIADDLPQVVNPYTGEYFNVEEYKWAFLIDENNETYWDDNGGSGSSLSDQEDNQGNIYYKVDNLYFVPTMAYFGDNNVKLEKGLYIFNSGLNSKQCYAVRLIDINTGGNYE